MSDAIITIRGTALTDGQAAALRVAVTSFHSEMADPDALGDDEPGRLLAKAYRECLTEVLNLLLKEPG